MKNFGKKQKNMPKIFWKNSVLRDIKNIDTKMQNSIRKIVENEIASNPNKGKPLKGFFNKCYSYRIGNYRIIYTAVHDGILILRVGHRKDVYRE
ncbi:MAG: hypothetical protein A2452_11555 [Candidatus Firestonebacteria bacterium RIFOXYC2_FULL_39_67]|nr:MAG: hypothetical protein A2536_00570 [Candidatus Firestonebacteria bacterium RIFOXYD2_FULL_39_29]OGF55143.1 MAG: hypothetical protein A2452_11555 [Candidatus Firestonebacteria bacterium RIFOXYC2_FULL_39_67]OGF57267.1 MAG: hypothetical protein A2497_03560 [Candidatus Firestonebacteria bacterium RifOxyC12_full_39_7]